MKKELMQMLKRIGGDFSFPDPPEVSAYGNVYAICRMWCARCSDTFFVGTNRFTDSWEVLPYDFRQMLYDAVVGILDKEAAEQRNLF